MKVSWWCCFPCPASGSCPATRRPASARHRRGSRFPGKPTTGALVPPPSMHSSHGPPGGPWQELLAPLLVNAFLLLLWLNKRHPLASFLGCAHQAVKELTFQRQFLPVEVFCRWFILAALLLHVLPAPPRLGLLTSPRPRALGCRVAPWPGEHGARLTGMTTPGPDGTFLSACRLWKVQACG